MNLYGARKTHDCGVSDAGIEIPKSAEAEEVCTMLKQEVRLSAHGPGKEKTEGMYPNYRLRQVTE